MKQKLINAVLQGMLSFLNNAQTAQLQKILERECVMFGKGSKERIVYFDARTAIAPCL